jgi:hypothetical protein
MTEGASGDWTVDGCVSAGPGVTLDAPATSGATYPAGTAFTLKATATVPQGRSVSTVEFFRDGSSIHLGTPGGAQHAWDWSPPAGNYLVTARVTDNTGAVADSESRLMIFAAAPASANIYYIHTDHLGTPRGDHAARRQCHRLEMG